MGSVRGRSALREEGLAEGGMNKKESKETFDAWFQGRWGKFRKYLIGADMWVRQFESWEACRCHIESEGENEPK